MNNQNVPLQTPAYPGYLDYRFTNSNNDDEDATAIPPFFSIDDEEFSDDFLDSL